MHQIREAVPSDADSISELYRTLVQDDSIDVRETRIAELATSNTSFLLIGEVERKIAATALLLICDDVMYGAQPFAVVENIVVSDGYRRQGLGSALMKRIELICFEKDCSKTLLSSSRDRTPAHKFFRKLGFNDKLKIGFVKYRSQFAIESNEKS